MVAYSFYDSDARLKRCLAPLARRGDTVDVIALRGENLPYYENINGVSLHRIQTRRFNEKGPILYASRLLLFILRSTILLMRMHRREAGEHVAQRNCESEEWKCLDLVDPITDSSRISGGVR